MPTTGYCARRSAVSDNVRVPVNRQTMITLGHAFIRRVQTEAEQCHRSGRRPVAERQRSSDQRRLRHRGPRAGQVLGHRRLRRPHRLDQIGDPGRSRGQPLQDRQSRGVTQGPEQRRSGHARPTTLRRGSLASSYGDAIAPPLNCPNAGKCGKLGSSGGEYSFAPVSSTRTRIGSRCRWPEHGALTSPKRDPAEETSGPFRTPSCRASGLPEISWGWSATSP